MGSTKDAKASSQLASASKEQVEALLLKSVKQLKSKDRRLAELAAELDEARRKLGEAEAAGQQQQPPQGNGHSPGGEVELDALTSQVASLKDALAALSNDKADAEQRAERLQAELSTCQGQVCGGVGWGCHACRGLVSRA